MSATLARKKLLRLINDDAVVDLDAVLLLIPCCKPAVLSEALIAAADKGHLEVVNQLARVIWPGSSHLKALGHAAQAGHMDVFRALLPFAKALNGTSSHHVCSSVTVMNMAARAGRLDAVSELISAGESLPYSPRQALRWAAIGGHLVVVQELLSHSDPESDCSTALSEAARCGHLEIVRTLISWTDPKADDSIALREAAEQGHLEITRLLIPVSDPNARKCEALRRAVANGHRDVADLLVPVSDIAGALQCEIEKVLSFENRADVLSALHAFDVLGSLADETTSKRAYTSLVSGLSAHMPHSAARYAAQQTQAQLAEVTPVAGASSSPRRSL